MYDWLWRARAFFRLLFIRLYQLIKRDVTFVLKLGRFINTLEMINACFDFICGFGLIRSFFFLKCLFFYIFALFHQILLHNFFYLKSWNLNCWFSFSIESSVPDMNDYMHSKLRWKTLFHMKICVHHLSCSQSNRYSTDQTSIDP